jgi:hypothetical protein
MDEALERMGEKNADADHAKECGNGLGHRNRPLKPRANETAWPAEQSKENNTLQLFRGATEDFRQHRMSERRRAAGEAGFQAATSRRKSGAFRRSEPTILPAAGRADR